MSQFYLNGPSVGRAMSAEEFEAAGRLPDRSFAQRANDGSGAQRPGVQPCPPPVNGCNCGCGSMPSPMPPAGCDCGCGNVPGPMPPMGSDCPGTTPDCPANDCGQTGACCQQMICCCRPVPTPAQPPQVNEGCCCKQSFRAALSLLCDQQISSLLDFDTSAFLTSTYVAGATLEAPATPPPAAGTPTDNLADTLTGSFRRFSPGNCDLLDVDAPVSNAAGTEVFTATQVSLCQLDAVVIQAAAAAAEGDLSSEDVTMRNFRCLRQRLAQRLNPCDACGGNGSSSCTCPCACPCDCCCAEGLLATLSQNNLSRRVSLAAGLLVLNSVTLLGTVGNVLVLSNDADNRLYFVCVNSVQFIG